MVDRKVKIELNNETYEEDKIFASIALRGGFITKEFLVDNERIFASNYAFYNILFQYWRLTGNFVGVKYDVLRDRSLISFSGSKDEYTNILNVILEKLFSYDYQKEVFEAAKKMSMDAFEQRYKIAAFRGKLKIYEVSDLNKRFQLKELIRDLEAIDFETFLSCAKMLLVPGNVYLYMNGNPLDAELIYSTVESVLPMNNHSIAIKNNNYDPYLKDDAHIVNLARENCSYTAVTFDFLNREVTELVKQVILEFKAAYLPYYYVEVHVDSLDANMIFENEALRPVKPLLREEISKEQFELLKKKILQKYLSLLKKSPELFAMTGADMLINNISLAEYIGIIDSCTYELYGEICEKSDFKITEAQVVLKKEARKIV